MRINLTGTHDTLSRHGAVFDPMKAISRALTPPGPSIPARSTISAAAMPVTPPVLPPPPAPTIATPQAPTVSPVAPMPTSDGTAVKAAGTKSVAAAKARAGRTSTVLTSASRAKAAVDTIAGGSDLYAKKTLG